MAHYNGRPCAACKHQRMKCTPECILAPYFPPDDPEKKQNFLNVKEVYGVNNVKEILSALDPKDRAAAVTSLVYEAEIRLKEPVYGSVGYVAHLQQKLKSLNTELASAYEELASLSGPSTGTMNRQQPGAAYGQMVYDPLQQRRRMMGVQLSSPAAVPYGDATSASHQAQMMGFGNNPSGQQQQQHGIGMDMRQYAAVVATDQYQPQPGVQLSSSAAQMDAPAVSGRAGKQIMMGVGLSNPSSSTSGQKQQYGINVDARQYAALVASHQHQPQPGVQLSSLAAQMGAPTVYGAGTQIMMGVGDPSSSISGQQQRYGIGVDTQRYGAVVATHHQHQPGVQLASPSAAIPYGMTQAQMMGTSDVYGGARTSQQAEMMGVGNDPSSAYSSSGLSRFTNLAPSSQSKLIGEQYGSGYVTTDQVQRHDELARNYSYQLHNQQQQGGLAFSSVLLPYANRTGAISDVYGGAGTSQQPQLYNQHEFGVDYTQQYAATDKQYEYISSDHSGGENRRR